MGAILFGLPAFTGKFKSVARESREGFPLALEQLIAYLLPRFAVGVAILFGGSSPAATRVSPGEPGR
jgi:hypothetical protein